MIKLPIYKNEFFKDKFTFHVDITEGLYQFLDRPEHISVDHFSEYNPLYFATVHRNAIDIYNYLFLKYEKLIFVTAIMSFDNIPKERVNFMSKYIRNYHQWKYHLHRKVFKNDMRIDEDFINCEYYVLKIDRKDLRHGYLFQSIANLDFQGRTPNINKRYKWMDCFIISEDENITFFMHDDRGIGIQFKKEHDYKNFQNKFGCLKWNYEETH